MPARLDLTGQTYGKLTVLYEVGKRKYQAVWLCQCECGGRKETTTQSLRTGHTKSCGCAYEDARPLYALAATTHGKKYTVEYETWKRMRSRCLSKSNPKYHRYGGRGITVSSEWDDFEVFLADMGQRPSPQHSLDRKDNDGPYCKDNCRWATPKEQASNTSKVRWLTAFGRTDSLSGWAAELKMNVSTLHGKLQRGESLDSIAAQAGYTSHSP